MSAMKDCIPKEIVGYTIPAHLRMDNAILQSDKEILNYIVNIMNCTI